MRETWYSVESKRQRRNVQEEPGVHLLPTVSVIVARRKQESLHCDGLVAAREAMAPTAD